MKTISAVNRIAKYLVAVLVFGFVGVVPTNATVTAHSLTIDAASDSITLGESATAILTHSFINLDSRDSVTLTAIVTSSNAATAGTIMLSVTDSYTSSGNDATAGNSPRYSFGGEVARVEGGLADSLTLVGPDTTNDSATGGTSWYRVNDRHQVFLTTNFSSTARDSITITGGATDSKTVGTANRSNGTVMQLKLYNPTAAGTYVVTVFSRTSANGASLVSATPSVTWTVTVTEPSRTAAASSTATLRQGLQTATGTWWGGTAEGTDSQTIAAATGSVASTDPEFTLVVQEKSLTSTNTARESYTVTVTGEAYVSTSSAARPTSTTGSKGLTVAHPTPGTPSATYIYSTGTAGTATITATTVSGLVLGTKTVTFYGDVATLAVNTSTYQRKIVRAGGFTSGTLFWVKATDAAGNVVQDVNPSIVSSDVGVITSGSCTDASSGVSDGLSACTVTSAVGSTSGSTATLTIRTLDPAGNGTTEYLTATYEVSLGGSVASEVITLDKTSYSPGEWMVVTVTAKDASGNPVYDGASAPTLTVNKSTGGTLTMSSYIGGVATSATRSATTDLVTNAQTLAAPSASGSFIVGGLSGATGTPYISVTGTVGDDAATAAAAAASDAALEAIDAANAATDAANLAAEAADAATVAAEEARDAADAATAAVEALASEVATLMAALKAQITTLAKTVAKIAKKVKV